MTPILLDATLAWALVGVVPMASSLRTAPAVAPRSLSACGVVAAVSFVLPGGPGATLLTLPWLAAAGVVFVKTARRMEIVPLITAGYLVVGAVWLAMSRLGMRPLDLSDEIVELTAVHFNYAGFIAPTVVLVLRRRLGSHSRVVSGALWCVLIATPLTAAGISFAPVLGALGAIAFAVGLSTASVVTIWVVVPREKGMVAALLALSAGSVIGAMVLAVVYAFGQWLGTPAPSLSTMTMTHGIANAFGFATAGTLGWVLAGKTSQPSIRGRARLGVRRSSVAGRRSTR